MAEHYAFVEELEVRVVKDKVPGEDVLADKDDIEAREVIVIAGRISILKAFLALGRIQH